MRDRAMLLLSARLGLRPSEVLRLRLEDLDWTAGSVLIRAGKTSRERVLPLPEDAGAALASYLHEARPDHVIERHIERKGRVPERHEREHDECKARDHA